MRTVTIHIATMRIPISGNIKKADTPKIIVTIISKIMTPSKFFIIFPPYIYSEVSASEYFFLIQRLCKSFALDIISYFYLYFNVLRGLTKYNVFLRPFHLLVTALLISNFSIFLHNFQVLLPLLQIKDNTLNCYLLCLY